MLLVDPWVDSWPESGCFLGINGADCVVHMDMAKRRLQEGALPCLRDRMAATSVAHLQ